jgi:hypothetical protein
MAKGHIPASRIAASLALAATAIVVFGFKP